MGTTASSCFADWIGLPPLHAPKGVQKPFGGLGGSNVFAPMRAPASGTLNAGSSRSQRDECGSVDSHRSFDAAIGPLWLQTLESCAGCSHVELADGGSASACERRVILNCEVATIHAAAAPTGYNVSLGLSNGENVTFNALLHNLLPLPTHNACYTCSFLRMSWSWPLG